MAAAAKGNMNGAQSLVHTMIDCGIDTCFANPGTSEMHFVAALDQIPGIRCILGLQENVVTGMADGYYRIAERPAASLLHCGPGLANGFSNVHNARRGRSGMVNVVGDQATWHRSFDAPLTTDTEAIARACSDWVFTSTKSGDVGRDAARAVQIARRYGGGVATLILPSDTSWDEGGATSPPLPDEEPTEVDPHAVETASRILREHGKDTLILLGARATLADAQEAAFASLTPQAPRCWRNMSAPESRAVADGSSSSVLAIQPRRPGKGSGGLVISYWLERSRQSASSAIQASHRSITIRRRFSITCRATTRARWMRSPSLQDS